MRWLCRRTQRRSNTLLVVAGLPFALVAVASGARGVQEQPPPSGVGTIARFAPMPGSLQLSGPVRAGQYVEASGRRAAFLGREEGTFEAWAYPLKILHDFTLSFQTAAYAEPMPGASLARWIDVSPERVRIRYAHAAFTIDVWWLVPLDAPGGVILLDIDTSTVRSGS
jgi:hypothetical protein